MTGELEKAAETLGVSVERLRDHQLRTAANDLAMGEPLPGAVRDAFAVMPDIKVGRYTVRPCYDADIEWLSMLEHPLHQMRLNAQASGGAVENLYTPQGPAAWELCYMFTHPVDEVDELMTSSGLDGFRRAARKEFSRLQLAGLVKLSEAAIHQYGMYWNPLLDYGAAKAEDDDGEPVIVPAVKKNEHSQTGSGS